MSRRMSRKATVRTLRVHFFTHRLARVGLGFILRLHFLDASIQIAPHRDQTNRSIAGLLRGSQPRYRGPDGFLINAV